MSTGGSSCVKGFFHDIQMHWVSLLACQVDGGIESLILCAQLSDVS